MKWEFLPDEICFNGQRVCKLPLLKLREMQVLFIPANGGIARHNHKEGKNPGPWEIWIIRDKGMFKKAYVCMPGEHHKIVNNTNLPISVMAIKGDGSYSEEDLKMFLESMGIMEVHFDEEVVIE